MGNAMTSAAKTASLIPRELQIKATEKAGKVSALWLQPRAAHVLLVFGHGAGARMRHPFMQTMADRLAVRGVATFRYQFPFMEKGSRRPDSRRPDSRRPDSRATLLETICSAVEAAAEVAKGLPLVAGGGRMTSLVAAEGRIPQIQGIVFFGFPLHATGNPSSDRGAHLADVKVPMLFLQGTRDILAELDLVRPLCDPLDRATLHIVEGGDHGFHVLKRSGRTDAEVLEELAETVGFWIARRMSGGE